MKTTLSIVIIGRNEEAGLAACLAAARIASAEIVHSEVIYVDSHSTDKSVAIASELGVRVIALPPDVRRCPSAGRYIGSNHAKGEFIIFLDADTHLYPGFLPVAIEHLNLHPGVAGANGRIDDLNEQGEVLEGVEERHDKPIETQWLRGPACFYRREALVDAGSFDPDLAMEEEAELGLRLQSKGWRLCLLPVPMACHTRCYHCQTFGSVIQTFRRDLSAGRLGEITLTMATAFERGFGFRFCWLRLRTTILLTIWILAVAACLLAPIGNLRWPIAAGMISAGSAAIIFKKRGLVSAAIFVVNKLCILLDVIIGIQKLWKRGPKLGLQFRAGLRKRGKAH